MAILHCFRFWLWQKGSPKFQIRLLWSSGQVNGKRQAARFDVSEIREGNSEDPQLQAGDIVVAGKSAFKERIWDNSRR